MKHTLPSSILIILQIITLALAASLPLPDTSPQSLEQLSFANTTHLLSPATRLSHPRHPIVPDPYIHHDERHAITIKFYGYGPPLPPMLPRVCLLKAHFDVVGHRFSTAPIGEYKLEYTVNNAVYVLLHLAPEMTWEMWGWVVNALLDFVEEKAYVDFDYDVYDGGEVSDAGYLGTGILTAV